MIRVGDRVVNTPGPGSLAGTVTALETPPGAKEVKYAHVKWDMPWGLGQLPPVRESVIFLAPESQTPREVIAR